MCACRATLRGSARKWVSERAAGLTGRRRKGVICSLVFKTPQKRHLRQVVFQRGDDAVTQIGSAVPSLLPNAGVQTYWSPLTPRLSKRRWRQTLCDALISGRFDPVWEAGERTLLDVLTVLFCLSALTAESSPSGRVCRHVTEDVGGGVKSSPATD